MTAIAQLSHTMPDRTRLRIPQHKGDEAFFQRLEQTLRTHPQVVQVQTNPLTGSVLVHYTGDGAEVLRFADEIGLFALAAAPPPAISALNATASGLDQLDHLVRRQTRGAFDLNEVLFISLIGAACIQILRGRIFAPATTLLSYAVALLAFHRNQRSDDSS